MALQVSYANALKETAKERRHLLLGNGFSLAAHKAFGYPSLFEDALLRDPSLKSLFLAGDPNFETALDACQNREDEDRLRIGLIQAVAAVHPQPLSLSPQQCASVWAFLTPFVGRQRSPRGRVFSTNYDILLHWVLSRQPTDPKRTKQNKPLTCRDGFEAGGQWRGTDADLYYLHGAVHIYDDRLGIGPQCANPQMLRYKRGQPLMKQVNGLLQRGIAPVFVAEGNAQKKKAALRDGGYLRRAKADFRIACGDADAALFTFGHSFGESDNHIVEEIGDGAIRNIFIGTYCSKDVARVQELEAIWRDARLAAGRSPLVVRWFDSSECAVWTEPPSGMNTVDQARQNP